jgi:predicted TIM-barrel fold metal-dependent hydrolase
MTRREWLFLTPAAAVLHAARPADAPFDRIDTHTHIHRRAPALLSAMEQAGWRGLSICDSRAVGDEPSGLEEMIRGTADVSRESKRRLVWAATFDARGFESPDFPERTIAGLGQHFKEGALGAKIWKNIGMGIRSKSGEYLLPDHAALTPILEAIQRAGKTLLAHLADPDAAWRPLDPAQGGYFKNHPEWHMYGRAGAPAKEAILAARDRILARHPKLRVIGCHLGSSEEDLSQVAKRLDAYPNFAVDVAARVRYLMRGDREAVRQFLLHYQDRILYATDFSLGPGNDEGAAKSFLAQHEREWDFFAGAEGVVLPEAVLRKIFRDNAVRWLPGIA